MRCVARTFLAAVQFLTTLPVRAAFTAEEIGRSAAWFPVVGLAIGGLLVAADLAAAWAGMPPALRAMGAIALSAALSGGLHLDGLADTADGFLSSRKPERILEIMRDSRIGAMGTLALFFVLGMKAASIAGLADGPARSAALLLAPVFGRSLQVVGLTWLPYARPEGGLASAFLPHRSPAVGLWASMVPALAAGAVLGLQSAFLLAGASLLLVLWWARTCRTLIGGMTGDTLGALSELGEVLVLALLSWTSSGGR